MAVVVREMLEGLVVVCTLNGFVFLNGVAKEGGEEIQWMVVVIWWVAVVEAEEDGGLEFMSGPFGELSEVL